MEKTGWEGIGTGYEDTPVGFYRVRWPRFSEQISGFVAGRKYLRPSLLQAFDCAAFVVACKKTVGGWLEKDWPLQRPCDSLLLCESVVWCPL